MQSANIQLLTQELEWYHLIGNKTNGERIGSGAYSHVYRVSHEDIPLAIKQVDVDPRIGIISLNEIDVSRRIHHPNIANIFGIRTPKTQNSKSLGLVLPLAMTNLQDYIRIHRPNVDRRLFLFYDLVCGVEFLHRCAILHMDLKPANILIFGQGDSVRAVVADFGLSIYVDNTKKKLLERDLVTVTYRAPEVFPNKEGSRLREYNSKVDIWSLGIMLLRMLNPDVDLFPDHTRTLQTINEIFNDNQRSATISRLLPSYIPKEIVDILNRMLSIDPNVRPSCQEILQLPIFSSREIPEGYICCPSVEHRNSSEIDYLVIDRIFHTCYSSNYHTDTVFLAVDLYHRSVQISKIDYKSRLLLAMTCVFMASKILEDQPFNLHTIALPEWSERLYISNNVKVTEIAIIKHLKGLLYRSNLFTSTRTYSKLQEVFETLRSAHIYTEIDMCSYSEPQTEGDENLNVPFRDFYPTTGYWKYVGYKSNVTTSSNIRALSTALYRHECRSSSSQ